MALIVKNLSKSFGTQLICQNFNLMMQPGDLTLLVGESGSGKTTILRMLNALETADQGTIELAGYDLISENGEPSKTEQKNYQGDWVSISRLPIVSTNDRLRKLIICTQSE